MIKAGQRLKETRLQKGLSIDQVSQGTKIRPKFITAIEKGEYDSLPSPAYAQGFVRNYAEFLGLSTNEVLALFRREFDEEKAYKVLPEGFSKQREFPVIKVRIQRAVYVLIGVFLLLGGFLLYQYRSAFFDPSLTVSSPKEGSITSLQVTVQGKTEPSATVMVNTVPVAVDDEGTFTKRVTLFPGKETIEVRSKNRFGRESVVERRIEVKQ